MEGCRSIRKRVCQRPLANGDRNPASTQVCWFWQQGKCDRSPCKFLHLQEQPQPQPTQVRKRPNSSSSSSEEEEDGRAKKRFTWTRNPTVNPGGEKIGEKEGVPHCVPEEKAPKRLCNYWANGSCVRGEMCGDVHSWCTGCGIEHVARLEGHKKAVTGVSFPPGSSKLYSGSKDGCLNVWDCNNGKCVFNVELGSEIGCMVNEPPWLFIGLENCVKACNLEERSELHLSGSGGLVRSLAFDSKTQTLYGGVEDGSILEWKATQESSLPVVVATYRGHQKAVLGLWFGKEMVLYSVSEDKTIRCWNREIAYCYLVLSEHTAAVTSVCCWENYLITASLDNTVKMWDWSPEDETLKVVRQFECESGILTLGGIHDKGKKPILVCCRTDSTILLLSLPTLSERGRLFTKAAVQTISVQENEESATLFFTGNATGQLDVWRLDGHLPKD